MSNSRVSFPHRLSALLTLLAFIVTTLAPALGTGSRAGGRILFDNDDALRRETHSTYTARGELARMDFPDGTSEQTYYDDDGRRLAHDDRRGKRTQFVYDARGRVSETWFIGSGGDAPVALSRTTYDSAGRVYSSTDARGKTSFSIYDDAGRRTGMIDALGQRSASQYDDTGSLRFFTDAKGRTIEHVYDALNRRTRTIFPPSKVAETPAAAERTVATETLTTYDELGRRIAEFEQSPVDVPQALRRSTRYVYDNLGRLGAVVQPQVDGATPITRYTYDELGNQLAQTDALGHTTLYSYDNLGRRTGRTLPGGQTESMTYNRPGTVFDRTDFNGTITRHTYEPLDRLLTRTVTSAAAGVSSVNVSFTYTLSGRRDTMTDATGVTRYFYDQRDRVQRKETPVGALNYGYENASGLLTNMHSDTSGGAASSYTYDDLGRLKTATDVNAQTTTYGYDEVGNLGGVTMPNGVASGYAYNELNRLQTLDINRGAATLAHFSYAVAPTGHRHRSVESGAGLQPANPNAFRTRTWSYDALWRLRGETLAGGLPLGGGATMPNGTATYALDAVGNRTALTSTVAGLATQALSYNANDRLTGDTYDANGNTLQSAIPNPQSAIAGPDTYDAADRLISRTGAASSSESLSYDGDGHRVRESVTRSGATTLTTLLVDDLSPTGYAQVVEEWTNGVLSKVFHYGHALISQDALLAGDWTLAYYGYDGHGSVRFLTNVLGAVTDTYEYDAFGDLLATTGATPNGYRYCGERFDNNLGLYYLRVRLMNPLTGRFWTADGYEGSQEDPAALHKYLYGQGNPVNNADPSGEESLLEISFTTTLGNSLQSNYNAVVTTTGNSLRNTIIGVYAGASIGQIVAINFLDNAGGVILGKVIGSLSQLRKLPGVVKGIGKVIQGDRWLRGSHGNAGFVPAQIGQQLAGRRFANFDELREAFWRLVAKDADLVKGFSPQNVARMNAGNAPIAHTSQQVGSRISYELHHAKPIQYGGDVYDLDNLIVVTPRYHQEILEPAYHY